MGRIGRRDWRRTIALCRGWISKVLFLALAVLGGVGYSISYGREQREEGVRRDRERQLDELRQKGGMGLAISTNEHVEVIRRELMLMLQNEQASLAVERVRHGQTQQESNERARQLQYLLSRLDEFGKNYEQLTGAFNTMAGAFGRTREGEELAARWIQAMGMIFYNQQDSAEDRIIALRQLLKSYYAERIKLIPPLRSR